MSASSVGQGFVYYDVVGGTCASRDSFPIDITSLTLFEGTASQYFMCPNELDTVQLGVNITYNGTTPPNQTYLWSPNTSISNINIPNPTVTLWTSQTYAINYDDSICPVQTDTISITTPYPAVINPTSDAVICNGSSTTIGASVATGPGDQQFDYTGSTTLNVENTTVYNLNVSGVAPSIVNGALLASLEMCLDISCNLITHLTIYLVAPSGETVLISSLNGGFATALTGATFSIDPTNTPISNYAGPFPPLPTNTTFLPQGGITGFNGLIGATTNGVWQLRIVHNNGGLSTVNGTLNNWCLNFQDLVKCNLSMVPEPKYILCCL